MKFEVDGVEYELVQSPTFGEAEDIEDVTGQAFSSQGTNPSLKFMRAMVWISMRRVNPDVSYESLRDLDMGVLAQLQTEAGPRVPLAGPAETRAVSHSA